MEIHLVINHMGVVKVVAVRMLPSNAMNQRLSPCIFLNAERFAAVTMRVHLVDKEALNLPNPDSDRIDHLLPERTVVWQEVDHPNCARFAHVKVRRELGSR